MQFTTILKDNKTLTHMILKLTFTGIFRILFTVLEFKLLIKSNNEIYSIKIRSQFN